MRNIDPLASPCLELGGDDSVARRGLPRVPARVPTQPDVHSDEARTRALDARAFADAHVGTGSKAAVGRLTAERFPEFTATQVRGWLSGKRPKILYLYELTQQAYQVEWSPGAGKARAYFLGAVLSTHLQESPKTLSPETPLSIAAPGVPEAERRLELATGVLLRSAEYVLWRDSNEKRRARICSSVLSEHVLRTTDFRQRAPWGVLNAAEERATFLQGLFQFSSVHIDYQNAEARLHLGKRVQLAADICLLLRSLDIDASVVGTALKRVHIHGEDSLRAAEKHRLVRLTKPFAQRVKRSHSASDVEFVLERFNEAKGRGEKFGPKMLRQLLAEARGAQAELPSELTIGRWLRNESIPAAYRRKQAAAALVEASAREIALCKLRERDSRLAAILAEPEIPTLFSMRLQDFCGDDAVSSALLGIPRERIEAFHRSASRPSEMERLRLKELSTSSLYDDSLPPSLYVQVGHGVFLSPEELAEAQTNVRSLLRSKFQLGDQADDIAQQAVVNLLRSQGFDPAKGELGGYLWGIARNAALSHIERSRPSSGRRVYQLDQVGRYEEDAEFGVAGRGGDYEAAQVVAERNDQVAHVLACLEELPDRFRNVLELRYEGGLSYDAIAQQLEIPIGTVMSRLHWARKRLASLMQMDG